MVTRGKDYFCDMAEDLDLLPDEPLETLYERRTFTVNNGQEPVRIDKWVQMHIEGATRNKVQKGIEAGFLTVNGKLVKSNYKIKPGDELILMSLINPEHTVLKKENIPLNIVYEDDALMVLNKPANMVVHPGVGNYSGTLLNGVAYYIDQQYPGIDEDTLPRYGLVHRIDKNTTGLIVLAKTGEAAAHLARQFFNHTVQRKYVDTGKHAITHYRVLERFHYVTLVECMLETGRTHQIRVHMKHIGHTLFNDWEYGGDAILKGTIYQKYKQFVQNCFEICSRCALHAQTLGFIHPVTGASLFFEAPLPPDMQQVIEKWRGYVKAISHRDE